MSRAAPALAPRVGAEPRPEREQGSGCARARPCWRPGRVAASRLRWMNLEDGLPSARVVAEGPAGRRREGKCPEAIPLLPGRERSARAFRSRFVFATRREAPQGRCASKREEVCPGTRGKETSRPRSWAGSVSWWVWGPVSDTDVCLCVLFLAGRRPRAHLREKQSKPR